MDCRSHQIKSFFLDSCTFSKRALQQLLPAEDEGTLTFNHGNGPVFRRPNFGIGSGRLPGRLRPCVPLSQGNSTSCRNPRCPHAKNTFFWGKKIGSLAVPLEFQGSNNKVKPATILGSFFHMSREKNGLTFHEILGCLMTGSLLHGLWNNLHINWVV